MVFRTFLRINNLEDNLHPSSPSTAVTNKQACLRKMVPGSTYAENSLADAEAAAVESVPLYRHFSGKNPHLAHCHILTQGILKARAYLNEDLETMICLGQTANELCIRNGQTRAVRQTGSVTQGKGHFHLCGFRAVMLLKLTMARSHCEKTCHVSLDKCPQGAHPCQSRPSD